MTDTTKADGTKADAVKAADTEAKPVDTSSSYAKPADTSHAKPAASSSGSGSKVGTYRVCAPYVTLKSKSDGGGQVVLGYYEGALVPETVDLDDLARHIRKGMVEKLEGAEAKAVDKAQAEAEKAEKAAEAPEDKEGAEAVKDAEEGRAAAEKAAADEEAEAKKKRTPLLRAADTPRGTATAKTG